jgi:hypothetical protein
MQVFKVLRDHMGDRDYRRGEIRSADENDVRHLLALGVLALANADSQQSIVLNPEDISLASSSELAGAGVYGAAPEEEGLI